MSVDVRFMRANHAIIFNLNQYTGNYERDFCAFVTGAVGECGVGQEMAELFMKEHPEGTPFYGFSDWTCHESDDRGCHRPVSIYHDTEVDEKPYDSLIIFLNHAPLPEDVDFMVERAKRFCAERPEWPEIYGDVKNAPALILKGIKVIKSEVTRSFEVTKSVEF